MSLNPNLPSLLEAIEAELHKVVDCSISRDTPDLRYMLSYHLGWEGEGAGPDAQGKRIRPLLVLLSCEAGGGKWSQALPAAAAVELIHNFSLIHDDIQDNSPVRRGRPTVWKKWGIAQAINTGDLMFTLANLALLGLEQNASPQVTLASARILQNTCVQLTTGQHLDLAYESRSNLSVEQYWPMVAGKTAALLAACTELGAVISGASKPVQASFHEFGRLLGLAFQVWDDWLGIWGDAALTGKSAESDLLAGKKSLPILHALSLGGHFQKRWQLGPISTAEVHQMAEQLKIEGSKGFTEETADRLTHQALNALQQAAPPSMRANLEGLAISLLQRRN